ncbi:unnamed protein product [Leptidea sinapis]|uniref:Uncharacterized protein n=1 Tax=Leptidea sinapis TaxID=189913 RepID=A0A5E4QRJ4_9NEOP|nr:unnamed protein product [Leptidea sinapis]
MNALNDKEIEIIDGKISENRLYLEDLRRILRHKQDVYVKKNKASLDLMCLYRMAKRQKPVECSSTNVLSKNELEEIKNLIKDKCTSSGGNSRSSSLMVCTNKSSGFIRSF